MKAKRRISAAEFEAIRPFLKLSDDRVESARAALVDGQTLQSLGDRFGWSRQSVGDAVSAVWRTVERYHQAQRAAANTGVLLPPGWEQVTLIAPSYLIDRFRAEIAEASPQPESKTDGREKPTKNAQ